MNLDRTGKRFAYGLAFGLIVGAVVGVLMWAGVIER